MGTKYQVDGDDLTAIANKIRSKGGTSASLEFPDGFKDAVDAIQTGITPTGTKNISTNGTHDVTNYASANVAVPASAVDTGTKNINSNGTHDVVGYASAAVSVPNSYSQSDEGKVVQSGALVAQTSDTVTQNGTVDTTLINSLTVNVSGGGGQVYTGTIELQNEDVLNLIIPIDISSGSAVVVAYIDRTGTIVDGNVVYDDEPIMPASATNTNTMIWYAAAIKQCDNKNMKRDASNYTSIKRPYNMSYCQAYFGNNGSAIGLDVNIVSGTKISLPSQNASRHWCKSGYYARWAYTVVVA